MALWGSWVRVPPGPLLKRHPSRVSFFVGETGEGQTTKDDYSALNAIASAGHQREVDVELDAEDEETLRAPGDEG